MLSSVRQIARTTAVPLSRLIEAWKLYFYQLSQTWLYKNSALPFLIEPKPGHKHRIYFGVRTQKPGGPSVRTGRMIETFGNAKGLPQILYVNSAENIFLESVRALKRLNPNLKIVVNQNGLYYPGWYTKGDWRKRNSRMLALQQLADHVLYQSKFCEQASHELLQFKPVSSEVLYNACPPPTQTRSWTQWQEANQTKRPHLFLGSVFNQASFHVLDPALQAMVLLKNRLPSEKLPLLEIHGTWEKSALQAPWFTGVNKRMMQLETEGLIKVFDAYPSSELTQRLESCTIALHLQYQDSCPNAVVERMAYGLGHIYSNSGGTPELVGESGIGLQVPKDWNTFHGVQPEALAEAIEAGISCSRLLGEKARIRYEENFTWKKYVSHHTEIFDRLLKLSKT